MTETPEYYAHLLETIRKILEGINKDEPLTTLNETSTLLKTLPDEFKKKHSLNKLERDIHHLLNNPQINRLIRLNTILKTDIETYIEYLDEDIGQDHRLYYQENLENDLITINEKIREFISIIITEKLNDEITL